MDLIQDKAENIKDGSRFWLGRIVTNDRSWKKTGCDLFGNVLIEDRNGEQRTISKDKIVYRPKRLMEIL